MSTHIDTIHVKHLGNTHVKYYDVCRRMSVGVCLINWLYDWLIDWLADWLTDWLTEPIGAIAIHACVHESAGVLVTQPFQFCDVHAVRWPINGKLDVTLMLVFVGGLRQHCGNTMTKLWQRFCETQTPSGWWEPKSIKTPPRGRETDPHVAFAKLGFSSTKVCRSVVNGLI